MIKIFSAHLNYFILIKAIDPYSSKQPSFFFSNNLSSKTNQNIEECWIPIGDEIVIKPQGYFFEHTVSFLSRNYDLLPFTYFLFFLGLFGIVYNYKNFFITMLSIELMYLGLITSFISISLLTSDPKGQIFALFFLIIAASESAIGLSLLVALHWFGRSLKFNAYTELRG